jgi:hypothetical protein
VSYDTIQGIGQSLGSLEDFLALLNARYEAAYDRQEHLNDFCVAGRYWLDSCGNFLMLDTADITHGALIVTAGRPDVASKSSGMMPRAVDACRRCMQPWRVDNLHDVTVLHRSSLVEPAEYVGSTIGQLKSDTAGRKYARCSIGAFRRRGGGVWQESIGDELVIRAGDEVIQNVWHFYHRVCRVQALAVEEAVAFRRLFLTAGYGEVAMTTVPNCYGSESYRGPWFEVEVPAGTIVIGWRKRVVNIDWSSTGRDLTHRFHDVTNTKGQYHVHAWTDDEVVDYLRRIRDALT